MDRFVNLAFHIDTNRINARCGLPWMNRLEQWAKDDVIMLGLSNVAQQEAFQGENPPRTDKAYSYIASHALADTPEEQKLLQEIEKIIFPNGVKNCNERNDVEIVFTAKKYGRILITNDGNSKTQPGGIIGHVKELHNIPGVQIMRDYEAVDLVNKKIQDRDEYVKRWSLATGTPLPDWFGKDHIATEA